jgi:hypothetical protein
MRNWPTILLYTFFGSLWLLALAACTPTADWPEGRGTEPPAQEWHGMPEPNPPSFEREDAE